MKRAPGAVYVLIALHFFLFAWLALFKPMAFLLDDAYYSLTVAANIAGGQGITYGGFATNGFQPLYSFLMTPVFALFGADRMLCLKIALLFGALCSAGSLWMLYRIAFRYAGKNAAVLAVLLGALSTNLLSHSASGLETSCHAFLFLLVVDIYSNRRASMTIKSAVGIGFLLALLAYARLDACFIFLAIGLDRFWINRKSPTKALVENLAIFVPACLPLVPWFAWNLQEFGTVAQSSGAFHHWRGIKTQGVTYALPGFLLLAAVKIASLLFKMPLEPDIGYRALIMTPAQWMLGEKRLSKNFMIQLWEKNPLLVLAAVLIVSAALFLLIRYGRAGLKNVRAFAPISWVLTAFAFAGLYYPLYLLNYSMRHFFAYSLLLAAPIGAFLTAMPGLAGEGGLIRNKKGAIVLAILVIAIFRCGPFDPRLREGNDYGFQIVRHVRQSVPAGASIGYTDCGFYGYFLPDYTVVNMDGILNFEAQAALRQNRLSKYLVEKNVGYVLALDNLRNEYRNEFDTDIVSVLEKVGDSDVLFKVVSPSPQAPK